MSEVYPDYRDENADLTTAGIVLAVDAIGYHDCSMAVLHDFDYWTRLILQYPIYVFEEPMALYRIHGNGENNSTLDAAKRRDNLYALQRSVASHSPLFAAPHPAR